MRGRLTCVASFHLACSNPQFSSDHPGTAAATLRHSLALRSQRLLRQLSYCTAIVTVLLVTPPAVTAKDTALPGVTLCGTRALICHRPTKPGAMPLNWTGAFTPPIVTLG